MKPYAGHVPGAPELRQGMLGAQHRGPKRHDRDSPTDSYRRRDLDIEVESARMEITNRSAALVTRSAQPMVLPPNEHDCLFGPPGSHFRRVGTLGS